MMFQKKPVTTYEWGRAQTSSAPVTTGGAASPFEQTRSRVKQFLDVNKLSHLVLDLALDGDDSVTILALNLAGKGMIDAYLEAYKDYPERNLSGLNLSHIRVKAYKVQIYPLLLEPTL